MIAILPAVQYSCREIVRYVGMSRKCRREDKRSANRRHRRYLDRVTRRFQLDPELFDDEAFAAPTLSDWDWW